MILNARPHSYFAVSKPRASGDDPYWLSLDEEKGA